MKNKNLSKLFIFLIGIFCLALFIPAGCKKTGEYISNYGKYADRFDFSDEELYDSDYYYEIKEQIARETPQKTTIVENGEEKEVDIYPCIIEVTLKKAEGYPILTLNEIFGDANSKSEPKNFDIANFYYIYKTPEDIPEEERHDGYEEDFRQKVAFILKTPTEYVITSFFSAITTHARTKINGKLNNGGSIVKNIEVVFIK